MGEYIFEFNLETGKVEKDTWGIYAIRYVKTDDGELFVEIGDGYRHYINVKAESWNRVLRIIRGKKLDTADVKAIIGLMEGGLPEEYVETFMSAVKNEVIPEITGGLKTRKILRK